MTQLNKTPFTLRVRRGTKAQITSAAPVPYQLSGELAYATDTEELYISNGTKFIPVNYASHIVGVDNDVVMVDNEAVFA